MDVALDPAAWGLLILTGGFIGLCFGLFGQAGGLALAPALLIVLPLCGVTAEAAPRLAVTTALAILIPVTIGQAEGRLSWKAIDWDLILLLAPGAAVGAVIAAMVAGNLDGRIVALLLGSGPILLALRLSRHAGGGRGDGEPRNPSLIALTLKTVVGGAFAALTGVSAGLVLARSLARALPSAKATATASALTLPFAFTASVGALLVPAPLTCGPACAGVLFLPALAAIGMSAVLIAPLALRLRPFLPSAPASRLMAVFAMALLCTAGLRSEGLGSLLVETHESALELALGSLCDPHPAPAAPIFDSETLALTPISEVR
ncbi:sulfite exporter TauE/SafE family protein [Rhodomicrobium sp. Az07]|uniref:sulfite exporter TauE/SafE family protein n=1 Tax=Rhodomicrobium sp. Az07 TaxID=2839034 RepID=UPI001BE73AEF|nr:sulfite exporter TauE/SafE family protein [Rhodomicrobium sp. Az07]MBT3072145.1 sulfite exporter TauE/SafE family protein [Rhodomicrobium sp. Az07]